MHNKNPITELNEGLKNKRDMHVFKMNEDGYAVKNPYAEENPFLTAKAYEGKIPSYTEVKDFLPKPIWDGNEETLVCYDKVWQLAFDKIRPACEEARILSPFIDCAFYDFAFMWDTCFIVMFGKYASSVFHFQGALDNFYAHQHRDGFICRQIFQTLEGARFSRDDPSSTGPNILPWAEWEYYCTTKDVERLKKVFSPLMAYHKWLQLNRTWQNGGYWSTGLGCGMDNQPRLSGEYDVMCSHGFMTWVDICAQQCLSANILIKIARIIGRENEVEWLKEERKTLTELLNTQMWNKETSFYYDLYRDGTQSTAKTIGAYWTLLAGIVPQERVESFVAHLANEREFKRPCMLPTLSADHPEYERLGGYWRGGVWAPTNYMVLKALEKYGYNDLAYQIACNYVGNVVEVFSKDGTVYENYAPEEIRKGDPALGDFVGWTGLAPISILFEYVFGLRAEAANKKIVWYVNRTERHGVKRYPLGDTFVDLICEKRGSKEEKPHITINCPEDILVEIVWNGQREIIKNQRAK